MAEPDAPAPEEPEGAGERPRRRIPYPQCCLLAGLGALLFFAAPVIALVVLLHRIGNDSLDQVTAWLNDVRAGRYEKAIGRMCAADRDVPPDALQERVEQAGGIREYELDHRDDLGSGQGRVVLMVTGDRGERRLTLMLAREDGVWRVCDLP